MENRSVRYTSGLFAGRLFVLVSKLFVPGSSPMDRRLFVFVNFFPHFTLHKERLQIQKGDGPWVSSQERRALTVLRVNRWFVFHRFT